MSLEHCSYQTIYTLYDNLLRHSSQDQSQPAHKNQQQNRESARINIDQHWLFRSSHSQVHHPTIHKKMLTPITATNVITTIHQDPLDNLFHDDLQSTIIPRSSIFVRLIVQTSSDRGPPKIHPSISSDLNFTVDHDLCSSSASFTRRHADRNSTTALPIIVLDRSQAPRQRFSLFPFKSCDLRSIPACT